MKLKINSASRVVQLALLIFVALWWGSSFILVKKALLSFSFRQVSAMRLFISFLLFLPFILKHIKVLNRTNIRPFLILNFLGIGVPTLIQTTVQTQLNSSLVGMLISMAPLFTMIVGALFYRNKIKKFGLIGILTGLSGAIALVYSNSFGNIFGGTNWYTLLIIILTISVGINVNEINKYLSNYSGLVISCLGYLFIGPLSGIFLLTDDFTMALSSPDFNQSLIFTIIFGFIILSDVAFNFVVTRSSPVFAMLATYLSPVVAIFWGTIDGEQITLMQIMAMLFIFAGVYFVTAKS
jgi:drug/metabolite transporter (DMT)-like permease